MIAVKLCELCHKEVDKNLLGETRKRILCEYCFSTIKQAIIYWHSENKFGREAISKKILELFGIFISGKLIENLLVSWDYAKRQRAEAIRLRHKNNPGTIKTGYGQRQAIIHRKLIAPIEEKFGKSYEEIIDEMYWQGEMSYSDIGRELGIPETTIKNWNNRKRKQKGRTVQNAMALPRYREKQKILAIRRRISVNQIGPVTSTFLANPNALFQTLTAEEIYSVIGDISIVNLNLDNLSQNFLVLLAKNGNTWAIEKIFEKYQRLVRYFASKYYLPRQDKEDLYQEGLIGLYKAINNFNPDHGSFHYFVRFVVNRQIVTALKTATRGKHGPLNYAELFFSPAYQNSDSPEERTTLDLIKNISAKSPEILVLEQERNENLQKILHGKDSILTELEFQSLFASKVLGYCYDTIATDLKSKTKTVDNAIQRAKKKIRKVFLLEDFEI